MRKNKKYFDVQIRKQKTAGFKGKAAAGGFFLMFLYTLLASAGIFWAFYAVFPVEYKKSIVAAVLVAACLVMAGIFSISPAKIRIIPLTVVLLGYAVCLYLKWDALKPGAYTAAEKVIEKINAYYRIHLTIGAKALGDAGQTTLFLIFCLLPVIFILAYGIIRRFSCLLPGLLMLLPVTGAMLVGEVPAFGAIVLMLIVILALAAGGGRAGRPDIIQQKASVWMLALAFAGILITGLILHPLIKRYYETHTENTERIKSYVNDEIWPKLSEMVQFLPFGNEGAVDGSLERGDFSFRGSKELRVTVNEKPESAIYLRGFVGDTYEGNQWTAVNEDDLKTYAAENKWEEDQNINQKVANLSYVTAQNLQQYTGSQKDTMTLERIHASGRYAYLPYTAQVANAYKAEGDGAIEGIKDKKTEFSYFANFSYSGGLFVSDPLSELYREYAYQNYLEFPSEQLSRLEAQCRENPFGDIWQVESYIKETLRNNASYNLAVETCPEGRDFAEYFLFEQKQGYCIHFATAATLMFRMYGIPARYVTGYIAPANTFFDNEDGTYTAELKDDVAHAWAEIYTDAGWVPVETTPPYANGELIPQGGAAGEEAPEATVTPTPTAEATPTETPAAEETPETPESPELRIEKQNRTVIHIGKIIGAVAAAILILFIIAAAAGAIRFFMRNRRFSTKDQNANIRAIYQSLHEALTFDGLPPEKTLTDEDFSSGLVQKYEDLSEKEADHFVDLVLRANYGPEQMAEEDTLEARRVYLELCRAILKRCSAVRKVIFRVFKGFY